MSNNMLKDHPPTLTKSTGHMQHFMLEYVIQHILNHERQYSVLQTHQRNSHWLSTQPTYRSLSQLRYTPV